MWLPRPFCGGSGQERLETRGLSDGGHGLRRPALAGLIMWVASLQRGFRPALLFPRPSGAPQPRRIPSQAFGVSLPRYHPLIRNTNTRPFRVSDRHHHRHKGSGQWCITKRMDARSVRPQLQTAILKLRRSVKTVGRGASPVNGYHLQPCKGGNRVAMKYNAVGRSPR